VKLACGIALKDPVPPADQQRRSFEGNVLDTYDFLADPRAISLDERRTAAANMQRDQQFWLDRLQRLAETPIERDFPAFLLATPPFAPLARRLLPATRRAQLSTEDADQLDWFVAAFADYLRTCDGEDVFADTRRRA
jgi:hypothetical protein